MYSGIPARQRRVLVTTLGGIWLSSFGAGVSGIVMALTTTGDQLEPLWLAVFSAILAVGSGAATYGVAWNKYRWEWIASWAAAFAIVPYVVLGWVVTFSTRPSNATSAFLLTALMLFYLARASACSAHAAKLVALHKAETAVVETVMGREQRDDGDTSDGDC